MARLRAIGCDAPEKVAEAFYARNQRALSMADDEQRRMRHAKTDTGQCIGSEECRATQRPLAEKLLSRAGDQSRSVDATFRVE